MRIFEIYIAVLLLFVAGVVSLFFWTHRQEKRWADFMAHWEAQGESFEISAHQPEAIDDSQNFAKHPSVEAVRNEDAQVMERLHRMKSKSLPDLHAFNMSEKLEFMPEPLARQVIDYDKQFAADFDALAEAAARPGCRAEPNYASSFSIPKEWLISILYYNNALSANAAAAIALGDEDTFTNQTVLLLDVGRHLRSNNTMVSCLIGVRFERTAYTMIRDLAPLGVKKEPNRARLLEALNRRKRPPREEVAKVLRYERAQALKVIDNIESSVPTSPDHGSQPRWNFGRILFAASRIALCEDSQRMLSSPDGRLKQEITLDDLRRYDEVTQKRWKSSKSPARYLESLGRMQSCNHLEKTWKHEQDRQSARDALCPGISQTE